MRMPGHPVSTALLVLAGTLLVLNTVYRYPINSAIGLGILAAGLPAYLFWRRRAHTARTVRTAHPAPPAGVDGDP
jgi:hypothetical protein